jgi:hypothetical protein
MYKEIIFIYPGIRIKHLNMFFGQNIELQNVEPGVI